MIHNTDATYGNVAKILHWVSALLIIGLIILGLIMTDLPLSAKKLKFYRWHKEIGILVLMLASVRLVWRFLNVTPKLPSTLAVWQKFAAHGLHAVLYLCLFAMPITGWLVSCAAGLQVSFFGLFLLPNLIGPDKPLQTLFAEIHELIGYGLIGMILGHVGAAFQHHFIYKDDILRRMLPCCKK